MKRLKNRFWTNEDEMMDEVEELGFDVIGIDYEYIYIMDIDDRMQTKQ